MAASVAAAATVASAFTRRPNVLVDVVVIVVRVMECGNESGIPRERGI
jgi:hypothetical protein